MIRSPPTRGGSRRDGERLLAPIRGGYDEYRCRLHHAEARLRRFAGRWTARAVTGDGGVRALLAVCIGAMRAGTTTLHNGLAAHPDIRATRRKEVHYFDRHYDRGPAWYRRQFPEGPGRWLLDVTPDYMYDPRAAERIAAAGPAAVIAVLRDPVARAYSQYLQKRSYGTEPLSLADAVAAERDRLRRSERDRRLYGYVDRSRYLRQLRPYERLLGREAMHVMLLEDLRDDPVGEWRRLFDFLDIGPATVPARRRDNPYVEFRSMAVRRLAHRLPRPAARAVGRLNTRRVEPPPLDPAVRDRLRELLTDEVEQLSAWLGRDLRARWWGSA